MGLLRKFFNLNINLSNSFDRYFLPSIYSVDGNQDFIHQVVPAHLQSRLKIYDIGGGKQPFIGMSLKSSLNLVVVGVDISQSELDRAPVGAYDSIICADIADIHGNADGDIVICQAVLEHVRDTEAAFRSIASFLKPGGKALIFVPSRNAVFARLNLVLPEGIKKKLLFSIYPQASTAQGFPSYYQKCTPKDFIVMANNNGLSDLESRFYFSSSYFSFMFPIHLIWRFWIILFKTALGHQAAETFSMILVKK